MTRKKQGAPQKLDAQNGLESKKSADEERPSTPSSDPPEQHHSHSEPSTDEPIDPDDPFLNAPAPDGRCQTRRDEKDIDGSAPPSMESSCEKLLSFTNNFLASRVEGASLTQASDQQRDRATPSRDQANARRNPTPNRSLSPGSFRHSASPTSPGSAPGKDLPPPRKRAHADDPRNSSHPAPSSGQLPSVAGLSPTAMLNGLDKLGSLNDMASINAARCMMDAMLRQQQQQQQQQFYDQCSNNWVNVQRTDNNCLSKSKAERYRWCVQGSDNNHKLPRVSSASHLSGLKQSTSLAPTGGPTVQDKLFGTVFAGASKFYCRDCGSPFNTLVELTVHMNKTGHFRDTNADAEKLTTPDQAANFAKQKKRSAVEEESQAEKVLTCMGCGHLFDSLQDLSVHMIKTKHYENVPSLRMWSQKQEQTSDGVTSNARKKPTNHMPTQNFAKTADFAGQRAADMSMLSQSPFYNPFLGAMANPASAAAAYASLLYSAPWMSPSFLPSFLGGAASLMYPFAGVPQGVAPPPFFPHPADTASVSNLQCTECSERFSSLQELAFHIKATSHFPSGAQTTGNGASPPVRGANRPGLETQRSDSAVADDPADASRKTKSTKYVDDVPETDASKRSGFDFIRRLESTIQSAISKVEVPQNSQPRNGLPPPTKFNPFTTASLHADKFADASKPRNGRMLSFWSKTDAGIERPDSGAFDRSSSVSDRTSDSAWSGEKTISLERVSAEAKVSHSEGDFSVRKRALDRRSSSPERRTSFGGAHSYDRSLGQRSCPQTDGGQKGSAIGRQESPDTQAADLSNGGKRRYPMLDVIPSKSRKADKPTETPLDLTVKREAEDSPLKKDRSQHERSPVQCGEVSRDGKTSTPNANVFSAYAKRSLSPNPLKSLFSFMRPKIEAAIAVGSPGRRSSDEYKPLVEDGQIAKSNPLQEILKIVHKTHPNERLSALDGRAKRSFDMIDAASQQAKKPKSSSLLQDLVVPEDRISALTVSPLRQMQDLVNNKLTNHRRHSQPQIRQTLPTGPLGALLTSLSGTSSPSCVTSSFARASFSPVAKSTLNLCATSSTTTSPIASFCSFAPSASPKDVSSSPLTSLSSFVSSAAFPATSSRSCDKNSPSRGEETFFVTSHNKSTHACSPQKAAIPVDNRSSKSLSRHGDSVPVQNGNSSDTEDELHGFPRSAKEILLEQICLRHFTRTLDGRVTVTSLDDDEVDRVAKLADVTTKEAKVYLEQANREPPFVRCHDDDQSEELVCRFCHPSKPFKEIDDLARHLDKHLEDHPLSADPTLSENHVTALSERSHDSDVDVTSQAKATTQQQSMLSGKVLYQGSMCFSPYRVPSASPPSDVRRTSPIGGDVSQVKMFRHHTGLRRVDDVSSSDDVIRVTG